MSDTKKTVVKVDKELMEKYRGAAATNETLKRVLEGSVARGADVTTPAYQSFLDRAIGAQLAVDDAWEGLFDLAEANGWDEETCTQPTVRKLSSTLSFEPLPVPAAAPASQEAQGE